MRGESDTFCDCRWIDQPVPCTVSQQDFPTHARECLLQTLVPAILESRETHSKRTPGDCKWGSCSIENGTTSRLAKLICCRTSMLVWMGVKVDGRATPKTVACAVLLQCWRCLVCQQRRKRCCGMRTCVKSGLKLGKVHFAEPKSSWQIQDLEVPSLDSTCSFLLRCSGKRSMRDSQLNGRGSTVACTVSCMDGTHLVLFVALALARCICVELMPSHYLHFDRLPGPACSLHPCKRVEGASCRF